VADTLADSPIAVESAVTQVLSLEQVAPLTLSVMVMFAAVRFIAEEVTAAVEVV
jgi:hypothetical protein